MNSEKVPDPSGESSRGVPLTTLLQAAAAGESGAAAAVLPRIYHELKAIARARMAGERRGHTLQATALVHEAWVRLLGGAKPDFASRSEFCKMAAEAMRRILIDHARRRARNKRGGGRDRLAITVGDLTAPERPDLMDPTTFLALEEALSRLEQDDPRASSIVRLRFFAGLDVDETAATLGLSRRTVHREWTYARARLFAALKDDDRSP